MSGKFCSQSALRSFAQTYLIERSQNSRLLRTKFTDLLGCRLPLQQAAIGSLANPRLASAVANAGGLGMVGITGFQPEKTFEVLQSLKERTSGAFGVNIIMPLDEADNIMKSAEAAARIAKVVEFFYGWPDPSLVKTVHSKGALVSWQLGSKEEAVAAEKAGCDLVVAQGIEAGGHIRGKIGLIPLLEEVLESVKVPVVAAGGIGSGRAMAAMLAAGASAVRIGTRFVAAREAEAHPEYVEALIGARAEDTVITERFSRLWPNAPHRVLRSSLDAAETFQGEIVAQGEDPDTGEKYPIRRFESSTASKLTSGNIRAMPLWAGESVGAVKKVQSAAEIVQELCEEAEEYLRRWND